MKNILLRLKWKVNKRCCCCCDGFVEFSRSVVLEYFVDRAFVLSGLKVLLLPPPPPLLLLLLVFLNNLLLYSSHLSFSMRVLLNERLLRFMATGDLKTTIIITAIAIAASDNVFIVIVDDRSDIYIALNVAGNLFELRSKLAEDERAVMLLFPLVSLLPPSSLLLSIVRIAVGKAETSR
uniref:Uncharacterized protein n=1 Tax=Glossina brevipalpis TaxID=37001 RepID=A0A1A9WM14_9MUSC